MDDFHDAQNDDKINEITDDEDSLMKNTTIVAFHENVKTKMHPPKINILCMKMFC